MSINLSSRVRAIIYALTSIASPVMFYLNEQAVVSTFWFGLYSVIVTAVTALAFSKVTPDKA